MPGKPFNPIAQPDRTCKGDQGVGVSVSVAVAVGSVVGVSVLVAVAVAVGVTFQNTPGVTMPR